MIEFTIKSFAVVVIILLALGVFFGYLLVRSHIEEKEERKRKDKLRDESQKRFLDDMSHLGKMHHGLQDVRREVELTKEDKDRMIDIIIHLRGKVHIIKKYDSNINKDPVI